MQIVFRKNPQWYSQIIRSKLIAICRYFDMKLINSIIGKRFSSTVIVENLTQLTKNHKKVLGPRSIVISSLEESHKNAAGKIWFELQKVGIQSTFLNLKSRYPSVESVQDGVNLLKRTGATSIVTIGNGTITDYGKAIQFAADSTDNLSGIFKDPTTIFRKSGARIQHIAVPVSPTPTHFLSTFQIIHPEEDMLLEIPGSTPSVVCCDPQFAMLSGLYHNPSLSKAVVVSTLFDEFIASYLHHETEEAANNLLVKLLQENNICATLQAKAEFGAKSYSELLNNVSKLRSEIRQSGNLKAPLGDIPEAWCGPLHLISMLMQTNLSLNLSLPYSYHMVTAAGSLLHHHSPSQRRRYVSAADKKLLAAIDFALSLSASPEGLNLPEDQILSIIATAMQTIEELVNKQPKLFAAPKIPQRAGSNANNTIEALTAAGNLEKVSVFLDYLSEKNAENAKIFAEKKLLLRSDLLLDVTEAMIESDMQQS